MVLFEATLYCGLATACFFGFVFPRQNKCATYKDVVSEHDIFKVVTPMARTHKQDLK